MSEANKGLARRSWEIVTKGDLDTLDDALQEVYADDIVMHQPDEAVRLHDTFRLSRSARNA